MDSTTLMSLLRDFGLWPEDPAVQQGIVSLSRQTRDGKVLARQLIQRELLTPYQANLLLIGKGEDLVVGPYRLVERLGEGATGQVFKARHNRLHRVVALKLIRPNRLANSQAVERFRREVQAAATFSHPNVVRAYDADQAGAIQYLAMQYVPGTTLSNRVKQNGALPISQACDIIRQAALGLQHIHEHGMVHRDIKPSNLAITEIGEGKGVNEADVASMTLVQGQVKILDLGLARLGEDVPEGQSRPPTLTQLGAVMGTTDYMSPEQGRDSRTVDARSDLYSLGCTLYYALTARPPFPGGTSLEKLMHHQLDEPTRLEALRPEVPPALGAAVRKMMAKEPAERYQKAAEVAIVLTPFCDDAPTQMIPAQTEPPPLPPMPALVAGDPGLPAPQFSLGDSADGPVVVLTSRKARRRSRRTQGEWLWVGIAGGAAIALLAFLALLRLILR
jgi:serine/threonine-protein kinase